jgi:hypothetical protein
MENESHIVKNVREVKYANTIKEKTTVNNVAVIHIAYMENGKLYVKNVRGVKYANMEK